MMKMSWMAYHLHRVVALGLNECTGGEIAQELRLQNTCFEHDLSLCLYAWEQQWRKHNQREMHT